MASISANGSKGNHKFTLNVTQSATDIANNKSTLSFDFKISPVHDSWNWELWGQSIAYTITINGTKYSGYIPDYDGYNIVTLKTGTQTVAHNADGSKSISYSFSVTDNAGQRYTPGNASASGTFTLATIPRASTISSVDGSTIGSPMTVNISRAVSTFTHQLWYKVGNSAWVDLGKGIGTSKAFTITPEFAGQQFPNTMNAQLTLCVRTYNGTTTIGSDYYESMIIQFPKYTPTISNIKLTGNSLLSGEYVKGKSTVTVEITASSLYGSTIKSYSATVDGKTYSGNKFTSSALSNGSKSVSVTITDTRGRTATLASSTITVRDYANPTITDFTLVRQSDEETKVIATVKGTVAAVNNKNAKTVQVTLNGVTQTITSNAYTINGTTTFTNVPTDNTLTGTAKITDGYTSVSKNVVLPTVAVTMDFHHSGKGIAMGKVAETSDLLDIAWKTKFNKAASIEVPAFDSFSIKRTQSGNAATVRFVNENGVLGYIGMTDNANGGLKRWKHDTSANYLILDTDNTKDYVIEQGTSDIWTYRKWNSGLAECWGVYTMTSAATKTWGTLYYSDTLAPRINYPFTFTSRPQESAFLHGSSVAGWVYPEAGGIGLNTTTQTGQYGFVRPTAIASSEVKYEYTVIGRWK